MTALRPQKVRIVEVGMRDGLQNEAKFIPTEKKIQLINQLSQTGLPQIEITSFVSPRWIPQLKDNLEVAKGIERRSEVRYSALVPNLKGLEGAAEASMPEIAVFLSASEGHCRKNLNKSVAEAMEAALEVVEKALNEGMKVRGNLSTVFGCPFDGEVSPSKVFELTRRLLAAGVYQVSLGDTTGIANPRQVEEVLAFLLTSIQAEKIALHFHDTRGLGLANALAGLNLGISIFDSSFGGLGGCPYAPGASGNIATEDLVYMLHGMGIQTGVDLAKLAECSLMAQDILGKYLSSKYLQTVS